MQNPFIITTELVILLMPWTSFPQKVLLMLESGSCDKVLFFFPFFFNVNIMVRIVIRICLNYIIHMALYYWVGSTRHCWVGPQGAPNANGQTKLIWFHTFKTLIELNYNLWLFYVVFHLFFFLSFCIFLQTWEECYIKLHVQNIYSKRKIVNLYLNDPKRMNLTTIFEPEKLSESTYFIH